jgi:hypothetical protein
MSEERARKGLERYYPKVVKKAARSTLEFSKAQLVVDAILAILITILGYFAGIVTSVGSTIVVIICGYLIVMLVTGLINVFRAPAIIHREQAEEIARLRQQLPQAVSRQLPAPPAWPEARPNVVCSAAGFIQVSIDDYDIVRRGWTHMAIVAQFANEPRTDGLIASEEYVMARIAYFDADGSLCQRANQGSWVEEEWRWVEFDVGDTRHLVLAVQLTDEEALNPALAALCAIENNHESPDKYETPDYPHLPPTVSRAEVQLFSGENGAIIGQFGFQFSFGEESHVSVITPPSERSSGQNEKAATPNGSE